MKNLLLLIVLVLSGCTPAVQKTERDLSLISGLWQGVGKQANGTSWQIRVQILNKSAVGDVAAKVDYPDLMCGGTWKLRNENQKLYSFLENISYGTNKCVTQGFIVLELNTERNELAYTYNDLNNSASSYATAILKPFK